MSDTQFDEDPQLTDYPAPSGSFGNLMHLSGLPAGDAQTLLFTIGTNHCSPPDP